MKRSSFILVFDPTRDNYLMGKRSSKNRRGFWDFFGGTIEENESPRKGGLREFREETGVKIDKEELNKLTVIKLPEKEVHVYFILRRKEDVTIQLGPEHSRCGWFKKRKLPKKITPTTRKISIIM